jgi:hypothetical protein
MMDAKPRATANAVVEDIGVVTIDKDKQWSALDAQVIQSIIIDR